MPANVRNFFIELQVDGRKTIIKTGPIAKDGGFSMIIKIRQNGAISQHKLYIDGVVLANGMLTVKAFTKEKNRSRMNFLASLLTGRR